MMLRIMLAAALTSGLAFHAAEACATDILVEIHGATPGKFVRVALFRNLSDTATLDNTNQSTRRVQVMPTSNVAHLTISSLEPGSYALSAYADLNDNQMLDKSFIGKPKEPYGASRNARNYFGPPTFGQCAFTVGADNVFQTINLE